jgi:hypothetical protein
MASYVPQDPYETFLIRIAQADAAKIQQAYFVAKAHEELAALAAGSNNERDR